MARQYKKKMKEKTEPGKKKEPEKKKEPARIYHNLLQEITASYVFLMLVVFPLFFKNKYYNIGNAKWQFFIFLTLGAGMVLIAVFLFYMIEKLKKHGLENTIRNIRFSVIDRFVLAYAVSVLISVLFSPYKDQVIWGSDGWYMGMVAQLCFVLIYYFVSRYWKWDPSAVVYYLAAAFLVFFLAVLMRFGIDPLAMYKDLEEKYIINFLSTIGQTTWYSSYMAILLPPGLFAFWFYDNKYARIFGGIFTSVGFMTMITQNSDSAFIALGLLLLTLFWVSMESNKRFWRFLEVIILCLASFKFIGICQLLFPENAVPLDTLSIFCSQGRLTWALLVITTIFYFCFRQIEKRGTIAVTKVKNIRVLLLVLLLAGIFATILYIYLNTMGILPEHLRSNNNYLLFDIEWGNKRGSTWTIAVIAFLKGSFIRKLFGCGPDGFYPYVQGFFRKELAEKWGYSIMLTCAHNEWLNALVNLGITGAIAYIGIFIAAIHRFFGKSKEHPELIAIAISILCYMGHNFFCYQQVVCTPTIFILIGAGESIIRCGKKE